MKPAMSVILSAPVAALLLAGAPAFAEDTPGKAPEERSLGERLDEAVKDLDAAMQDALRSVERLIEDVPGYEAPEVLPNGDIIIRKKRPPGDEDAPSPQQREV